MTEVRKPSPTAPPGALLRSTAAVETEENRRQFVAMALDNIEHVDAGNTPGRPRAWCGFPCRRTSTNNSGNEKWRCSAASH